MITRFRDNYRFLSNFWLVDIELDGIIYPSVEHAYQASKTLDKKQREKLLDMTAGQAKRYGRKVSIRPDWETIKLKVMEDLVRQKFTISGYLKTMLLETGNEELIEGNPWRDTFWGVCNGIGNNHLGKIIMNIREELRIREELENDGDE